MSARELCQIFSNPYYIDLKPYLVEGLCMILVLLEKEDRCLRVTNLLKLLLFNL